MIENIRKKVQERYGKIAAGAGSCCDPTKSGCGCSQPVNQVLSQSVGYSDNELKSIPQEANLGLGCGNPLALASLRQGETVLDLGSGGGIDCFLASQQVGPQGRVIGVDMTADMIHLARENAAKGHYTNVEFRLGEIEHLPVADASVDVVISNCVINLSVDKNQVFREIFRVLKSGGRMMVSDIVLTKELPEQVQKSVAAYTGCIAGALPRHDYLDAIKAAGFTQVKIMAETGVPVDLWADVPIPNDPIAKEKISKDQIKEVLGMIISAKVYAEKQA
jgi:SAM-dependent methyltransferase